MPNTIGIVGADAVGKTSFALALGAKAAGYTTNTLQQQLTSTFLWPRPGGNGHKKTTVYIFHSREETIHDEEDTVYVFLFDLTRRDSLATVLAQWAHLLDTPGRRLLLVGTHADCVTKREVSPAEAREISGDFHAYEEVCCRPVHSGDEGLLRVQLTLMQWTSNGGPRVMANDIPLARASICGGFPRPVVTMVVPAGSSHSLPVSPAGQQQFQMRAGVWLCDPIDNVSSSPVATGIGGDVKLRTISKAIYDIRGAVAEKSKALAKYRDRQVSHWLTRSRYFGPTESSRHKRWQEEQKKRQQLTQSHVHHHHHAGHMRHQPVAMDELQEQRGRSVSHPNKVDRSSQRRFARRGPAHCSGSNFSENEKSPGSSLERKLLIQATDQIKQRQRQLEVSTSPEEKKRVAAIRALRKQRRAASNDIYERSTSPPVCYSYLNCYDEMDMPPQLQPSSPSLDRRKSPVRSSPVSSVASLTSCKSCASREVNAFNKDSFIVTGVQQSLKTVLSGAEPMSRLSTPLPSLMSPPDLSSQLSSALRQGSVNSVSLCSPTYDYVSKTVPMLTTLDNPLTESKPLMPSPTTTSTDDNCFRKPILPVFIPHEDNLTVSRTNTMCSSSSETLDCSDIDDMLEYFETMTLSI
ncbi:unnamed protein product [Peronospora belbahrii]|uniref:Uncharacterized protein n=1 Tax=Peronospora belbahrii TaxID=622444 RepID=A0ABN8CNG8_9STRA|nr:unnamed protein product [Peronospora belbahrii]